MGYTHYWYQRPADRLLWNLVAQDVRLVLPEFKRLGVKLAWENHYERDPEIGEEVIRFNGTDGQGYETFFMEREPKKRGLCGGPLPFFACCKTGGQQYDVAVCAVLLIAKHYLGADIEVSSDGDDTEWKDAKDLVERVLGYGDEFHFAGSKDGSSYLRDN